MKKHLETAKCNWVAKTNKKKCWFTNNFKKLFDVNCTTSICYVMFSTMIPKLPTSQDINHCTTLQYTNMNQSKLSLLLVYSVSTKRFSCLSQQTLATCRDRSWHSRSLEPAWRTLPMLMPRENSSHCLFHRCYSPLHCKHAHNGR